MPTKEQAYTQVQELEALEFISLKNSASYFSNSISWHPSWAIIFRIVKRVREEYEFLLAIKDEINQAIVDGRVETIADWGGGWSWKADIVRIQGRRIRIFGGGKSCCIYAGQHDRPVLNLSR